MIHLVYYIFKFSSGYFKLHLYIQAQYIQPLVYSYTENIANNCHPHAS